MSARRTRRVVQPNVVLEESDDSSSGSEEEPTMFMCRKCNDGKLYTQEEADAHRQMHQPRGSRITISRRQTRARFYCKICKREFHTASENANHKLWHKEQTLNQYLKAKPNMAKQRWGVMNGLR